MSEMSEEKLVSLTRFAAMTGRSRQAITKLADKGTIPTVRKGKRRLVPVDEAKACIEFNLDPVQVEAAQGEQRLPASGSASYYRVRTAQLAVRLQRERVELDQLLGKLVDRDMALRKAFEFSRGIRDAVLNFPNRYSPVIAAELGVDAGKVHVALEKRLKEYVTDIANRKIPL